ncbi:hypothetical protein R84B8_02436 [Treponema sp. R8-4-B8]
MKNERLTIKTLNFSLSLFLFIFSLFVFSACPNLFNPELTKKPASGKGSFQLSINGLQAGRTILPATAQSDFNAYTLDFYDTEGNLIVSETRTNSNLGDPVFLDPGTYKLSVTAYMDAEKTKPAACGELAGISITLNASFSGSVTLTAIISEGQGDFKWNINYPSGVTIARMTVTPFENGSGTPEQTLFFIGGTPVGNKNGSLTLNSGYYRVTLYLFNNNNMRSVERREILHIYKNMDSSFTYTFTDDHFTYLIVTSGSDSGAGTLRNAISAAPANSTIIIDPEVKTIALGNGLSIDKNISIEGNGVTIKWASSWTSNYDRFLSVNSYYSSIVEVTISRVWFKDGRTTGEGGAFDNSYGGNVTLESCIFSGNRSNNGGAIRNNGIMSVKGCTFYGNRADNEGGAIYSGNSLTLTGNLFYKNTASSYPVLQFWNSISSTGYNVVDIALGESPNQSGWFPNGDITVNIPMVSPTSFKLLPNSQAADIIIEELPYWYPTTDFYGNPINLPAAAGAVQDRVNNSGYYLELSVNDDSRGTINVTPPPDTEGFVQYPYIVIVTANPVNTDCYLAYWLVNGVKTEDESLELTLTSHTRVQAVFSKNFLVTNFDDPSNSETTSGTLRHALTNVINGDKVIINETAGQTTITLTRGLSLSKSINIEGNGVIITRASSWQNDRFLNISDSTVTISRVWFKDGRTTGHGAAVYNYYGNVTLESCIFSGNQSSDNGGAIYNYGTMKVKGCTFYGNRAENNGGAIYTSNGTLTLTGNLFYGNTAYSYPAVGYYIITSAGYNLVDVPLGNDSTNSGWTAGTGDIYITTFPISGKTFKLLPSSEAAGVITSLLTDYPTTDFYGNLIELPAAAGAVQGIISDSGIYIELSVNESGRGSISASPTPSTTDGLVNSTTVAITANPASGYYFVYWLVNGKKSEVTLSQLTLSDHARVQAVFGKDFNVIKFSDNSDSESDSGTLRHALTNAIDGDKIIMSKTLVEMTSLVLTRGLSVSKSITIEGNGVTITRGNSWTSNDDRFLSIRGSTVTISHVWFKDGRTTANGAAVSNDNGNVTLESCIFSGNQSNNGGAIYNRYGSMNVKGCTFYGNSAVICGGAIYGNGTLALTGNLFYLNTASSYPVLNPDITITSTSYNVVNVPLSEIGFSTFDGNKYITTFPVSGKTFRFIPGGGTENVITTALPADYPTTDFYGNSINVPAAAGAVQGSASDTGYYLELSVDNSAKGSISASPAPDPDGLVASGPVTITATSTPGYDLAYWLVNGNKQENTGPLLLTVSSHNNKVQAVFEKIFIVNDFNDYSNGEGTEGTLRHALAYALDGDKIRMEGVNPGVTIIALRGSLPNISHNITIEGNGVTITRASSWSGRFLYISNSTVTISRVWFKDGMVSYDYGAAICNSSGNVTLESCIFSGNRSNYGGGAIYNYGTMNVKGCTFYGNSASNDGGAIYRSSGTLTLTGNLFYGNTALSSPVVSNYYGTSNGYNVVDVTLGPDSNQSGWTAGTGDRQISAIPVSGKTFKLLPGSQAANVIATLPIDYPTKDFYGADINPGAAAGAVQGSVSDSGGIYIDASANDSVMGSVSVSPSSGNNDGLVSGPVTITATPASGYHFAYWLVNGNYQGNTNPLQLNIHARVQAVFGKELTVSNYMDIQGSESAQGTLRNAITNAKDGDRIVMTNVRPGQTTVTLRSSLYINRNITIEGNGITFNGDSNIQILYINSCTVTISRVWFKDGRTDEGAAVYNDSGNITIESCIFSGNQGSSGGGAIINYGIMNVKGCTFYNNSTDNNGGAIYNGSGTLTLTLTGNLFYGNTAEGGSPVVHGDGTSNGYNVVDFTLGPGSTQSGFTAGTGDTTFTALGINGTPINTATFEPVQGLRSVIPPTLSGFPTKDFYGENRSIPGAPGAVK